MICKFLRNSPTVRIPSSKWYISKKTYTNDVYPDYCDGPAYIFTSDLAEIFFIKSLHTKMFPFEDVHIGMLAENLNVNFLDIQRYYDYWLVKNTTSIFSE